MKTKARVLYLSYDGMTDPLGQSQVLSYLAGLSKSGFDITLLSYEKPEVFSEKEDIVEEQIAETGIKWEFLNYTKSPPILSTLKDLRRGWERISKLSLNGKFDIVHCRGYITAFLGDKYKKTVGAKFIFDMRGWWPDEKLESGLWDSMIYKPVYQYFKRAEKRFFQNCDYAISLTQSGKEEIKRLSYKKDKIGVIPTCVNFDVFKPFDQGIRDQIREELNIPSDSKVLLYSGSFGGNYGAGDLLRILEVLKQCDPNAILLLVSQTDADYIKAQLAKCDIDISDVRIINSEYKEVYKYLMAGDVGAVTYKLSYSVIGRSPTKLGEYWACGLPVIALSGIGDIDCLINKFDKSGVLISEPYSKEVYKKAIEQVLGFGSSKDLLRKYARDYYDLEIGVQQYNNIYESLLAE